MFLEGVKYLLPNFWCILARMHKNSNVHVSFNLLCHGEYGSWYFTWNHSILERLLPILTDYSSIFCTACRVGKQSYVPWTESLLAFINSSSNWSFGLIFGSSSSLGILLALAKVLQLLWYSQCIIFVKHNISDTFCLSFKLSPIYLSHILNSHMRNKGIEVSFNGPPQQLSACLSN